MFAPFWVKLKWLFTNGIEIIYVDNLDSEDRGGFGSTGKK
jgi:dUTPase